MWSVNNNLTIFISRAAKTMCVYLSTIAVAETVADKILLQPPSGDVS
jgi:hypothetical protein